MTRLLTGMLWLDADNARTVEEKIGRAAWYYRNKFGREPNIIEVDLGMVKEETVMHGIRVVPMRNIQMGHMMIGEEERNG